MGLANKEALYQLPSTFTFMYMYNRTTVHESSILSRVTAYTDIFVRVSGGETPSFRPPIPPNDTTNDAQLIQLMRDCWDEDPTLRPDFSTIRSRYILINKGKYDTDFNVDF